ncbi:GIY-YIG nuclease family protein [Nocardioides caldifontis]|uniref:GIY-YIG nuclease family protein n=1 Tax=Nocardioides caldifontis TaxID=2588938 RepID=UPI00193AC029
MPRTSEPGTYTSSPTSAPSAEDDQGRHDAPPRTHGPHPRTQRRLRPFNFDVHALFFSEDAVAIESQMHQRLADRRVNRVNPRREFFYATPAEARDLLTELTGELLQFDELPEAVEYHQSQQAR